MRDQLTALEITDLVKRLAAAYGKPYGARTEALVAVWDDKLRYYPGSVVRAVLERWIETESRFPTIAAVLARGELNAHRGVTWEANPWVWAITFRRLETEVR